MKLSPKEILRQYFRHEEFRPMQEEIINEVLKGQDVLAILPTGAGKSICYQVPALAKEGLCLVISPLIALIKDQVDQLRKKGITALTVDAGIKRYEAEQIYRVASQSNCRFLYVSPERLQTIQFKEWLPALGISMIAVDEAHCISQWGYDFRPSYLKIAGLRQELEGIPVLALSASATKEVGEDICRKLEFLHPHIFRQSFERPNLSYSAFYVPDKKEKIREAVANVPGSGLVYCRTRKKCEEISDFLSTEGFHSGFYHAGLSREERTQRQQMWQTGQLTVMVCTNAFGMGIDKPDVRKVIHADIPDSMENYYQEAGRAGRDGNKSYALLLIQAGDTERLKTRAENQFPSSEDIRKVYQAIMNYLQIPSSSGGGQYFGFDMEDFIRKFKLSPLLIQPALQTMEQEGLLCYYDRVFLPAEVGFQTDRNRLMEFEKQHPELEKISQFLLRNYPGIFDRPVPVREKSIAYRLKKDLSQVIEGLQTMERSRIILFQPSRQDAQLYLVRDRMKSEDFHINEAEYLKRKSAFASRIDRMAAYAESKKECRSQFIARYFGQEDAKKCGICDNCILEKKSTLFQPGIA
jgi:ATP-dependent DNA helicase RecQ